MVCIQHHRGPPTAEQPTDLHQQRRSKRFLGVDTRGEAAGNAGKLGQPKDDVIMGEVGNVEGAVEWKQGGAGD